MGLFDALFGGMEGSSRFTIQEAFAGILFGASACDGHIADDEMQGIVTALIRMKLFQKFSDRDYNSMMNKLHGVLKKRGVEALIDLCVQSLPRELCNTAFANACDIVLADGVVEPDERTFMNMLQAKLQIDPQTARSIGEVMVLKNKG